MILYCCICANYDPNSICYTFDTLQISNNVSETKNENFSYVFLLKNLFYRNLSK